MRRTDAAGNPLTPVQQWDLLCKSPAFQAGLRAQVPEMTAAMARTIVPLLRPGLKALEELKRRRETARKMAGARTFALGRRPG